MSGRQDELREKTVYPSDPHTMVKHLVYRRYLECWMPKILQTFPRAAIVDAFAGAGVYQDGLPGSSLLVASTFRDHTAYGSFGELDLICLEQRPDRVQRLRQEFAAFGDVPKLHPQVVKPAEFEVSQASLSQLAHGGDLNRPVLWLLDPYNINSLPYSVVKACLVGSRDEVVATFFVDEMHRFCTRQGFDQALTRHFGSAIWETAVPERSESARKAALVRSYETALQNDGLLTGNFGVRVRNDTARYNLVFATHSKYGLDCWNPVKWKLDKFGGSGASAATVGQADLFGAPVTGSLDAALDAFDGQEKTWDALMEVTRNLGHLERHLRAVLDAKAEQGLAYRASPTSARSAWPEGCVVRFYTAEAADLPVVEPLEP